MYKNHRTSQKHITVACTADRGLPDSETCSGWAILGRRRNRACILSKPQHLVLPAQYLPSGRVTQARTAR
jgi:hypothetical protein